MPPVAYTLAQRTSGDHLQEGYHVLVVEGVHEGKRGKVIALDQSSFGRCFAKVAFNTLEGTARIRTSDLNRSQEI